MNRFPVMYVVTQELSLKICTCIVDNRPCSSNSTKRIINVYILIFGGRSIVILSHSKLDTLGQIFI